jgi:hypothetical protein
MATLWVGSRKGLFRFDEGTAGWKGSAEPAFLAAPVTAILDDPRDGALYLGLAHGHFGCKFHRSDDRGASWTELAAPAFPKSDAADAPAVEMIWCFATGGRDEPGTIWAGTLPGGLFRSDDRGATWQLCDSLWNMPERARWFGAGYDHPGIHSILIDPRDSAHMIVGVSVGGLWITHDRGKTWTVGGKGFWAEYMPPGQEPDLVMQDPHLLVASPTDPDRIWCQHHCGIYVSDDGGHTFRESKNVAPASFGFGVAPHPHDRDRAWFVPAQKDEYRVPVGGKLVVTETRDGGHSYVQHDTGLPKADCWDLIYRHAVVADGSGTRVAMGSTTGNLWLSADEGRNWQHLSAHLPPIAALAFAP